MGTYRGKGRYLGAWSYVLLSILYIIPVIGWIILIVHAFKKENENLCHYARSFFVRLLLVLIAVGATVGIMFANGQGDLLNEIWTNITSGHFPSVYLSF